MKAIEYLKQQMQLLASKLPTIRLRYDYHCLSKTHTIEVFPSELYNDSDVYKQWESDVMFAFLDLFSNESLTMVDNESILGIDKVDFEVTGVLFGLQPSISYHKYYGVPVLLNSSYNFDNLFTHYRPSLDVNVLFEMNNQPIVINQGQIVLKEVETCYKPVFNQSQDLFTDERVFSGETPYALAA